MQNTKEIIRKNLVALRKSNNLTQTQLAEKIGYNDKAISRWESGIVFPDLDVIDNLCELYKVSFSYLIETHDTLKYSPKKKREGLIILLASIQTLWIIVVAIFLGLLMNNINIWQIFIIGGSFTFVLLQIHNFILLKKKSLTIIYFSLIIWSFLTFIYLTFLSYNLWIIFLAGLPLESSLFLYHYSKITK